MKTTSEKQISACGSIAKLCKTACVGLSAALFSTTCLASTVTLQWNPVADSSVAGYRVYYKADSPATPFNGTGAAQGGAPIDVAKQNSATISGLDPLHPYYFAVTAYNAAGVESAYSNIASIPELSPPAVAITYPGNNSAASGTVSVTASASDNAGVSRVEFYVNGVLKGSDTSTPYLYSWNTSQVASGAYTLVAKAYDAAGNVGSSGSVAVTVVNDVTAPTVSLSAPGNNATVSGTVPVTATASDDVGVAKVEIYQDGSLLWAGNVAPFGYSWNTSTVSNGSHLLSARAYDAAGNAAQSGSVAVTVDNPVPDGSAPVVSLTAPAANSTVGGSVTVTAAASDNIGVSKVEFYLNGVLQASDSASPFSFGWNTASVANGSYTLSARAYDAAGNVGRSASLTVSVFNDAVAPSVGSFSMPASAGTLTVAVASFAATDNVGVTGYLITESATPPAAGAAGWSSSAPASFTFAGYGARTAYAWARDAAGNVSSGKPASVNIAQPDTTAPSITALSPKAGSRVGSSVAVRASATDNVAVTRFLLYLDDRLVLTDTDGALSWTWNTRYYSKGAHVIKVTAYDAANNASSRSVTVYK